ncbi:ATP-binding cassette domain-containing protein [Methylosoma difficile]
MLKFQKISFGFSPEKKIFTNLSFCLEQGKIYALMGANGSGKTTLFNLISGFHKTNSRSLIFKNKNITQSSPHQINKLGISRTFQELRLISNLPVRENILLATQPYR